MSWRISSYPSRTAEDASPTSTEHWDDDGSPAFRQMMERLERERMVLER
jgi:hypothetical protein